MRYRTAVAFRAALEQRLLQRSRESGIALDRLRRRVLLDRIVSRLVAAQPEAWVLKGGMALEVRLGDRARLTKDIDLGLRDDDVDVDDLHELLLDAFSTPQGDHFAMTVGRPERLGSDGAGLWTWRAHVDARLGGKPFGRVQLDISPRRHELVATDQLTLPATLGFAGIPATVVDVVDVPRHAAEKLHAMTREFGDRENTRLRDLVDVVTLIEQDLLDPVQVGRAVRLVWAERDATAPPQSFPPLPPSWADRYPHRATEQSLTADTFSSATTLVIRLWQEMFPTNES